MHRIEQLSCNRMKLKNLGLSFLLAACFAFSAVICAENIENGALEKAGSGEIASNQIPTTNTTEIRNKALEKSPPKKECAIENQRQSAKKEPQLDIDIQQQQIQPLIQKSNLVVSESAEKNNSQSPKQNSAVEKQPSLQKNISKDSAGNRSYSQLPTVDVSHNPFAAKSRSSSANPGKSKDDSPNIKSVANTKQEIQNIFQLANENKQKPKANKNPNEKDEAGKKEQPKKEAQTQPQQILSNASPKRKNSSGHQEAENLQKQATRNDQPKEAMAHETQQLTEATFKDEHQKGEKVAIKSHVIGEEELPNTKAQAVEQHKPADNGSLIFPLSQAQTQQQNDVLAFAGNLLRLYESPPKKSEAQTQSPHSKKAGKEAASDRKAPLQSPDPKQSNSEQKEQNLNSPPPQQQQPQVGEFVLKSSSKNETVNENSSNRIPSDKKQPSPEKTAIQNSFSSNKQNTAKVESSPSKAPKDVFGNTQFSANQEANSIRFFESAANSNLKPDRATFPNPAISKQQTKTGVSDENLQANRNTLQDNAQRPNVSPSNAHKPKAIVPNNSSAKKETQQNEIASQNLAGKKEAAFSSAELKTSSPNKQPEILPPTLQAQPQGPSAESPIKNDKQQPANTSLFQPASKNQSSPAQNKTAVDQKNISAVQNASFLLNEKKFSQPDQKKSQTKQDNPFFNDVQPPITSFPQPVNEKTSPQPSGMQKSSFIEYPRQKAQNQLKDDEVPLSQTISRIWPTVKSSQQPTLGQKSPSTLEQENKPQEESKLLSSPLQDKTAALKNIQKPQQPKNNEAKLLSPPTKETAINAKNSPQQPFKQQPISTQQSTNGTQKANFGDRISESLQAVLDAIPTLSKNLPPPTPADLTDENFIKPFYKVFPPPTQNGPSANTANQTKRQPQTDAFSPSPSSVQPQGCNSPEQKTCDLRIPFRPAAPLRKGSDNTQPQNQTLNANSVAVPPPFEQTSNFSFGPGNVAPNVAVQIPNSQNEKEQQNAANTNNVQDYNTQIAEYRRMREDRHKSSSQTQSKAPQQHTKPLAIMPAPNPLQSAAENHSTETQPAENIPNVAVSNIAALLLSPRTPPNRRTGSSHKNIADQNASPKKAEAEQPSVLISAAEPQVGNEPQNSATVAGNQLANVENDANLQLDNEAELGDVYQAFAQLIPVIAQGIDCLTGGTGAAAASPNENNTQTPEKEETTPFPNTKAETDAYARTTEAEDGKFFSMPVDSATPEALGAKALPTAAAEGEEGQAEGTAGTTDGNVVEAKDTGSGISLGGGLLIASAAAILGAVAFFVVRQRRAASNA